MITWVGVDSIGNPCWHTQAETEHDCRELIQAGDLEEGDVLLVPRSLVVSWEVLRTNSR